MISVALLASICACSTSSSVKITHSDFGESVHDIRVEGGESLPPQRVRELFDQTAKQICGTVDAKSNYKILILTEQPSREEALWDTPESYMQQRLARNHYDVYHSNMEGKILCE